MGVVLGPGGSAATRRRLLCSDNRMGVTGSSEPHQSFIRAAAEEGGGRREEEGGGRRREEGGGGRREEGGGGRRREEGGGGERWRGEMEGRDGGEMTVGTRLPGEATSSVAAAT
ncbi:hypothetical protein ACH40E_07220 [Streptomyces acidicola]|uniref:hypothetical protein n=1 Tax=Streptomyces acidicola TaxID=2596892 RepID=UPI0037960BA6